MRVQKESDRMVKDNPVAPSDSPQLKYVTLKSQENQVSKVVDSSTNTRQQCVVHIYSTLNNNSTASNNVVNIQLNYNINQALDSKL